MLIYERGWFIKQIENLKKSGIPYSEIAFSLGVKPQYLNLIKNTNRGASERLTLKLCEVFNINHNDLLDHIRTYENNDTKIDETSKKTLTDKRTPLHGSTIGRDNNIWRNNKKSLLNETNEWIDTGNLFPGATSAIRHYDDSMSEYPPGSILLLKRMVDKSFIIWGRNYYVEANEVAVTKRLQDGGKDHIIGYSTNLTTYPDGRLIHEPVKIPKKYIRHIYLILGCVTKEFDDAVMPTITRTIE